MTSRPPTSSSNSHPSRSTPHPPSLEGGRGGSTGSRDGVRVKKAKCENCTHPTRAVTQTVYVLVKGRRKFKDVCDDCYQHSVILPQEDGSFFAWYMPQPHQRPYHESDALNLLALGTRGTGKSTQGRKDAIIRCMQCPGYKVLILRRKIPDLRKSHLQFINAEMKQLGDDVGHYRQTTFDVVFENGSFIQFSHCESIKDVENYLGSEWDLIIFDEVSTFTLSMFLTICAASRTDEDAPYRALVRCLSNPLGIGAAWMKAWFIDKNVDLTDYEDYNPDDYEMQFSTLDQNVYVSRADYEKRLRVLPAHIKKAWLRGEFVIEGAYFTNFHPTAEDETAWHAIDELPVLKDRSGSYVHMLDLAWLSVYRALDWGYFPDPAVCLWIAVLPDGHEIVFKEKHWRRTLAKDVAKEIKRESVGMHVVETFCDPSIASKDGSSEYSIAEQIEMAGVPLTPSQNSRELFGYSVCEHLDTEQVYDAGGKEARRPKMQILEPTDDGRFGCKELLRTIPLQQMDETDPRKLAPGEDHWVVALAYFCMGRAMPGQETTAQPIRRWMIKKKKKRTGLALY